jgi:hypothetical protein
MNKVINELFNRAGGWTEVCDVSGEEILTYNEHLDPEKFAELIIRECAEFVRKENYKAIMNETPFYVTSSAILENFGVEE